MGLASLRPSSDLEHFAIECYRKGLPESMFGWRSRYVYGTPALRPFVRTMTEEEAKGKDLMGRIPGILEPNPQFVRICECAEAIGIRLRLRHDVPALENLSMYPNEERCRACMRRGCSNWSDRRCWGEDRQGACCGRFVWDRKTPSSNKTNRKKEECREDGGG